MPDDAPAAAIRTEIPYRLDRLPWSRFHWLLVLALGVTWVLDGLEATVVAAVSPILESLSQQPEAAGGSWWTRLSHFGLQAGQIGVAGTVYLAGCIAGAILFGHLTDRLGRKKLFTVTLGIYLAGAALTAFSWNFWSFLVFRCLTGLAIGGEYSAINSAIDELIPARVRGRVDLAINGSYWVGAILGAGVTVLLLNGAVLPHWVGWRVCFGLGAVIGGVMIVVRHYVPESPRWLLIHGRQDEAEAIMKEIEAHVADPRSLPPVEKQLTVYPGVDLGFGTIAHTMFVRYRRRAVLGLVLIASQAFFYNGISFTYPLVLSRDFGVHPESIGLYVICMAVANFLGPLVLGHWFDTVGRRKMITLTYAFSGLVIVGTEVLFLRGWLNAQTQTGLWAFTFFFASAAASAGYLTVSEIFPLEMRALAIALFYAIGTALGGLGAPALFGALIETNQKSWLAAGYLAGAALMLAAAAVEWWLGVDTEQKSLEDVTAPLTSEGPLRRARQPRQASAA